MKKPALGGLVGADGGSGARLEQVGLVWMDAIAHRVVGCAPRIDEILDRFIFLPRPFWRDVVHCSLQLLLAPCLRRPDRHQVWPWGLVRALGTPNPEAACGSQSEGSQGGEGEDGLCCMVMLLRVGVRRQVPAQ